MSDHTPLKRCTQCGESKPATTEYFSRKKDRPDGLYCQCKVCKQAKQRAHWAEHADEINEANRNRSPEKREHLREVARKWRAENHERVLEDKRLSYWRHREKNVAKSKAWHAANAEWKRAYDREYLERNRTKIKAYQRKWNQENRERLNEQRRPRRLIDQRARMTRKLSLPIDFTRGDWQRALDYFGGHCAICDRPPGLSRTLSQDHWIPLSDANCPGTIPANVVPLCHGIDGCNNSKKNRHPAEWLTWKFGKEKGDQIAAKIQGYFDSLRV